MAEEKKEVKTRRPTAQKRDLQNAKKRLANRSFKARVRTAVRNFEKEVEAKNETQAKEQLSAIFSLLDKGVKHSIYTVNKVGRLKSKFASRV